MKPLHLSTVIFLIVLSMCVTKYKVKAQEDYANDKKKSIVVNSPIDLKDKDSQNPLILPSNASYVAELDSELLLETNPGEEILKRIKKSILEKILEQSNAPKTRLDHSSNSAIGTNSSEVAMTDHKQEKNKLIEENHSRYKSEQFSKYGSTTSDFKQLKSGRLGKNPELVEQDKEEVRAEMEERWLQYKATRNGGGSIEETNQKLFTLDSKPGNKVETTYADKVKSGREKELIKGEESWQYYLSNRQDKNVNNTTKEVRLSIQNQDERNVLREKARIEYEEKQEEEMEARMRKLSEESYLKFLEQRKAEKQEINTEQKEPKVIKATLAQKQINEKARNAAREKAREEAKARYQKQMEERMEEQQKKHYEKIKDKYRQEHSLENNLKSATATEAVLESDSLALVALYNSCGGPDWYNKDNWLSGPVNTWYGVVVDTGRVSGLELWNNNLVDSLPAEIGQLTALVNLSLSENQLTGTLPIEIGQLNSLRHLYIGWNQLSGLIPAEIGLLDSLRDIQASSNSFSGSIPIELGQLTELTSIDLSDNDLSGIIPQELDNLNNLNWINLGNNQLTGSILSGLGNLTNLQSIYLWNNQFTGDIPAELGNFSNLTYLGLNGNQLTGNIPSTLGSLSNLWQLSLSDNQLSGSIPPEIGNLSNLRYLELGWNNLSGTIPPELTNLTNLEGLSLHGNDFNGSIPSFLGNFSNLYWLGLSNNNFSGTIPSELGQLIMLQELNLGVNELNGSIPPELGNISNLQWINLEWNQLEGTIPQELFDSLRSIQVYGNYLDSLYDVTSCPNLFDLNIQENSFTFEDLEYNMDIPMVQSEWGDGPWFYYSGQRPLGDRDTMNILYGESYLLDVDCGGTANQYQWYRNGFLLSDTSASSFQIENIVQEDEGEYWCRITNNLVPDLTIETQPLLILGIEPPCNVQDSLALVALYNNCNGPGWQDNANWLTSVPVKDWYGVTVAGGRVTELELRGDWDPRFGLTGALPTELADLTEMVRLDLSYNNLTDSIDVLMNMIKLEDLNLWGNEFSGNLPPTIGQLTNLQNLSLGDNQFSGSLPMEIGQLTSLNGISLGDNNFSGSIPSTIGNLTSLSYIDFGNNQFSGNIPSEIGNLSNLWSLYLWTNQLSGSIPAEIGNLSNLSDLGLGNNQLSGSIPTEIGNLTNLYSLYLWNNQLSGEIPAEIGLMTNLRWLGLNNNNLEGSIPDEISGLLNLESLEISGNFLSDSIPASMGLLLNLNYLNLNFNNLDGNLPVELESMSSLKTLSISNNLLTGTVPIGVFDIVESCQISDNRLDSLPDISNCPLLYNFSIENNNFDFDDLEYNMDIPMVQSPWGDGPWFYYSPQNRIGDADTVFVAFGDTVQISVDAGGTQSVYQWYRDWEPIGDSTGTLVINDFDADNIGSYFCQVTNSLVPDLTLESEPIILQMIEEPCNVQDSLALVALYNATNGDEWNNNTNWLTSVPVREWYGVVVAGARVVEINFNLNNLIGTLPTELGDLEELTSLGLSNHQISGSIPSEIWTLTNLRSLRLQGNQFTGNIPPEIGNLSELEYIDLGGNQLSGEVPPEIGLLNKLRNLNLYANQLIGLPSEIGQLTSLQQMNLRYNQLSGSIPPELGQLTNLSGYFFLDNNQFSGQIPEELGQLVNINRLSLYNNDLTGALPSEILNIPNLEIIEIQNNNLDTLPDLTSLSYLTELNTYNNRFTFEDLEHNMNFDHSINFFYSPQQRFGNTDTISLLMGDPLTLQADCGGTQNRYIWYLNGEPATDTLLSGDLVINSADFSHVGNWVCYVTNTLVPDLTLESEPILVEMEEPTCNVQDSLVLVALYNATQGQYWGNNENWLTTAPVKDWYGITQLGGRVNEIDLMYNGLQGQLPSDIGQLEMLEVLRLGDYGLTGSIPPEIGNLINLEYLLLSDCQIGGTIPTEIGNLSNLTHLYLNWMNNISGEIPASIGNCTSLQYLNIYSTNISGLIPAEIGNLTNLLELNIRYNYQLAGPIPASIGNMSQLRYLNLRQNNLSGTLPAEISQMANLQSIILYGNYIDELPDIQRPDNLYSLEIPYNNLTFEDLEYNMDLKQVMNLSYYNQRPFGNRDTIILDQWDSFELQTYCGGTQNHYQWYFEGNPVSPVLDTSVFLLDSLDFSNVGEYVCFVTNDLVTDLTLQSEPLTIKLNEPPCNVQDSLALVALYNATNGDNWNDNTNWLTTAPVESWFGITQLAGRVVKLKFEGYNNLNGTIPPEIGQLDQLKELVIYDNWNLTGGLPNEIGSLISLERLDIGYTALGGIIPSEIGQLTNLHILALNSNQLIGSIPIEIGQLDNLIQFFAYGNLLTGMVPAELFNLNNLEELWLQQNQLSGLPADLSLASNLHNFYISDNNIKDIPELIINGNMYHIHLSDNYLTFDDLEPNMDLLDTNPSLYFRYWPQKDIGEYSEDEVALGANYTLSASCGGTQNQYQWMKDWSPIGTVSANSDTTLQNFGFTDQGYYKCQITNSLVPNLTLYTADLMLQVAEPPCNPSDSLALVALYNATDGDNWNNNENWLSKNPVKDWYGVITDGGRVVSIELTNNNLNGTLTSEIGDLNELIILNLSSNQNLKGSMSGELMQLTKLEDLELALCDFTGPLPSNISQLTNLQILNLSGIDLGGSIPDELGQLSYLGYLSMSDCNLVGEIPSSIGNLYNLYLLQIANNNISGSIPVELGNLSNLESLYLQMNHLTGELPVELGQLFNLRAMLLVDNRLSGEIPLDVIQLPNLNAFYAYRNQFDALPDIPLDVAYSNIALQNNQLTFEDIEYNMDILSQRILRYTPQNRFGEPQSYLVQNGDSVIISVSCGGTQNSYQWFFKGDTLTELSVDSSYVVHDFDSSKAGNYYCQVHNAIVTDLVLTSEPILLYEQQAPCNLQDSLILVELYNATDGPNWNSNNFWLEGPVHTWYGITVENQRVTDIILASNSLFGVLPVNLGLLSELDTLILPNNSLSGQVYPEYGNISKLRLLDLSANDLDSVIPPEIGLAGELRFLNLGGNKLTGNLPDQLWDLPYLYYLNLGSNKFTGTLSGKISQADSLAEVYLSDNSFEGVLPDEIWSLSDLKFFNVNTNNFSGTLSGSIANASRLENLYMYGNQLSGTIPTELWSLSNIKNLNLANNQFSGSIEIDVLELDSIENISLYNNELSGELPVEFGTLNTLFNLNLSDNQFNGPIHNEIMNQVTYLNLANNHFDSLPEIQTPPNLGILDVRNNNLSYEDFEYNMDAQLAITPWGAPGIFNYVPQNFIGQPDTVFVPEGGTLQLNVECGGTQNQYRWYHNGIGITGLNPTGTFEKSNFGIQDEGTYFVTVENTLVPSLILESHRIEVYMGDAMESMDLSFDPGWNLFSSAVTPDTADMKYNFQPLINNTSLVKIQDETGMALENWESLGGWQNDIGDISPSEGYKVKVNEYSELELSGTLVTYPYGIFLEEGWNIIGYPQLQTVDALEVIQQLVGLGELIKVQDEKGNSIENLGVYGGWYNFIGNMVPGEGYKVKVAWPDTLWIQESYPKSLAAVSKPVPTQHFNTGISGNGVDHMNLYLVDLPVDLFNAGDELAVYDGTTCVGAVVIEEDHLTNRLVAVPASAKDDSGMPGFTEGNNYNLRIWQSAQNLEIEVEPEYISGAEHFTKHESVILSLEKSVLTDVGELMGKGHSEVICYPNPFEQELVIELDLPAESEVEIKVVNQTGQLVASLLTRDKLNEGIHRYYWNTKENTSTAVAPGIFYILTSIDDMQFNNKVVLTR